MQPLLSLRLEVFWELKPMKHSLKRSAMRAGKASIVLLLVVIVVLGGLYWRFGEIGREIYVEAMFGEVRDGPYETMEDVDRRLSWLSRSEIARESLLPHQVIGRDLDAIRDRQDLTFISYRWSEFGFVVVFDQKFSKVTVLASDI